MRRPGPQELSLDAVVDTLAGTVKVTYATLALKCFDDKCQEPPCAREVRPSARGIMHVSTSFG